MLSWKNLVIVSAVSLATFFLGVSVGRSLTSLRDENVVTLNEAIGGGKVNIGDYSTVLPFVKENQSFIGQDASSSFFAKLYHDDAGEFALIYFKNNRIFAMFSLSNGKHIVLGRRGVFDEILSAFPAPTEETRLGDGAMRAIAPESIDGGAQQAFGDERGEAALGHAAEDAGALPAAGLPADQED